MAQLLYFLYWGKARPNGSLVALHLLPYHCLDVAAVGVAYLRKSRSLRRMLKKHLNIDTDEALYGWVAFWLALHDLGKFSEAFQGQLEDLFLRLRGRAPDSAKHYRVRHDSLGMLFWKDVLFDRAIEDAWFGVDTGRYVDGLDFWMRAVAGHHGQPPNEEFDSWTRHFHERDDKHAVLQFIVDLRALFLQAEAVGVPTALDPESFRLASVEISWWMAGIAVLADWIGSNSDLFEYRDQPTLTLQEYWALITKVADCALNASGVLPVERQESLDFKELFPRIEHPSPLQDWASKVTLQAGPQVHLLEDVTGAGKTEAAVMLAHRIIANGSADGFFIGLPTMATSNAMYGRVARVYAKLFAGHASLVLAHRQRTLVEDFAASVIASGNEEFDTRQLDDTATARCTAWLADHNKRALLAPAGVGTIDQALLAALQSRHQSLRLLGLFGKVLLVDEVHACDAYMQGVLEALLRFHARAGGSAILLSATMPQRMKAALLSAFATGCHQRAPALAARDYPLVTSWSQAAPDVLTERSIATRAEVSRRIAVRYESDREQILAAIDRALEAGRCVCWIRNTVADALDAYTEFSPRMQSSKLMLFHARFALRDRLDIEASVLASFGPESKPEDRSGRLLIATQVAEQSLDVDFDLVITDLAPIDRLIQRAGRMHRHVRDARGQRLMLAGARDQRGEPSLLVFGPKWVDQPSATWFKNAFPKAANVYPHHSQLWLTARALRGGSFEMPGDARRLVEGVFSFDADAPEGLSGNANRAEGQAYGDASLADLNSAKLDDGYLRGGSDWLAEGKVPSRLGEDTTEVLLARWDGDRILPWASHPVTRHAWAYSSVRIARRLIAQAPEPTCPNRRQACEAALASLPGQGKWSLLLVLEMDTAGGVASAYAQNSEGQPLRLVQWRYDARRGLRAIDPNQSEDA